MKMNEKPTTPGFKATWANQYGLQIGSGTGPTREEAVSKATTAADKTLRWLDDWKWKKAKLRVTAWNI
jgi:hypothetical protein